MSKFCGHCGSEVADGYAVCKGCGAHERRNKTRVFIGLVIATLAAGGVGDYVSSGEINTLGAIVTGGLIGLWLIRSGWRKRWYRYNA